MGVQAVSRTKWRRRPRLGGAGPGGLQAGRGAGTSMFISVILWFSRNVTAQPQIMKSPTFSAAPSGLPGRDPAPTITTPIELRVHGTGADPPGYRSMCPAQTPVTPRPFLQHASHCSRSARGTGTFAEKAAVVSKRVPWVPEVPAAPASPAEASLFSLPLSPNLPVAETSHFDLCPFAAFRIP